MSDGEAFWEWLRSNPWDNYQPKPLKENIRPKPLKVTKKKKVNWDAELKKLPRRLGV